MSTPAILHEPYRKRPSVPQDLSWHDPRPASKPAEQERAVREALAARGAVDLLPMLFGPMLSGGAS